MDSFNNIDGVKRAVAQWQCPLQITGECGRAANVFVD
jgi:hypothetical protein